MRQVESVDQAVRYCTGDFGLKDGKFIRLLIIFKPGFTEWDSFHSVRCQNYLGRIANGDLPKRRPMPIDRVIRVGFASRPGSGLSSGRWINGEFVPD